MKNSVYVTSQGKHLLEELLAEASAFALRERSDLKALEELST